MITLISVHGQARMEIGRDSLMTGLVLKAWTKERNDEMLMNMDKDVAIDPHHPFYLILTLIEDLLV